MTAVHVMSDPRMSAAEADDADWLEQQEPVGDSSDEYPHVLHNGPDLIEVDEEG